MSKEPTLQEVLLSLNDSIVMGRRHSLSVAQIASPVFAADLIDTLTVERDALRASVGRLEGALRNIIQINAIGGIGVSADVVARQALADTEGGTQ